MSKWLLLLAGWLVWTAHFFSLYAIASLFMTSGLSRILVAIVTAACVAGDGLLLWWTRGRAPGWGDDVLSAWMLHLAGLGAAVSLVAVLWQGLPALIG